MRNLKVVFSRSYGGFLHYYISFLLVFFATSASLFVLIPGTLIRNFIAIMFAVFLLVCSMIKSINKRSFVWISLLFVVTLINGYYLHGNILYVNLVPYFTYLGGLLICLVGEKRNDWVGSYLSWSKNVYLCYAIATIILRYTPTLYRYYVVPLFSYNSKMLLSLYRNGCMAGLTSHYSTNAMLLSVGILICFARIITYSKKKRDYVVFGIMLLALMYTGKRAHFVFCLLSMLAVYFICNGGKKGIKLLKYIRALLLMLVVGIILYYLFPSTRIVYERILSTFESNDITNNRVRWWAVAIEYFKKNFLFGIGWGNFYNLCGKVTGYYANTHNVYLQLLCETGIFGFTIYILWIIKNIYCTIKSFIRIRDSKEYMEDVNAYYYLGFSLAYQIFFILYCFTGNPLYDKEMFIPYFVSCAISMYYSKGKAVINVEEKEKGWEKDE